MGQYKFLVSISCSANKYIYGRKFYKSCEFAHLFFVEK